MSDAVRLDARFEARDEVSGYRRIELISGRRQRRAWSDDEKARIVAESAEAGANISEVADRNGVSRGLLTVWRRAAGVVRARGMPPSFIPVEVEAEAAPRAPMVPCGIEVDLRAATCCVSRRRRPRIGRGSDWGAAGRLMIYLDRAPRIWLSREPVSVAA
ncbi:IS66 family insertion sequence hypothetical protein [Mesorhizobium tamadayense]|uniref:Transposase n=1 Tax=Mesorhizobium tamadayense TaxID=425306 RepID=A0A3P3FTG7_9HYPH|nr:transposase [Mesorhizobium tamadayense]RRI01757.1 IS66 family insertion sequence hypothetical protein [Mesorhizobium tamadayense]